MTEGHDRFAFLIHPPEFKDVARRYSLARYIPDCILAPILTMLPPLVGPRITGVKINGREVTGRIVICPLTARQILAMPELAARKVTESVLLAERLGCEYIGLGAFTSIATDGGLDLKDKVRRIKLTSGNAYAAALILENMRKCAGVLGLEIGTSTVAVVGAAGSVGSACAKILARTAARIICCDKRAESLDQLRREFSSLGIDPAKTEFHAELPVPIRADFVATVASASEGIIQTRHLLPGTVVIDAAQPHNTAREVGETRPDVLVIHSGIAYLPGIDLHMDVGINKQEVYACLGEVLVSMQRELTGHYSLGQVDPAQVEELMALTPKAGLCVASFRNRAGPVGDEDFQRVRQARNAR